MRVAVATATTPPRQATPTHPARHQNPGHPGLPCPGRPSSAPGSPRQGRLWRRPGERSAHLDPGHRSHDPWQLSRTRDQTGTPTFPAEPHDTTPQTTTNQAQDLQSLDVPLHMSALRRGRPPAAALLRGSSERGHVNLPASCRSHRNSQAHASARARARPARGAWRSHTTARACRRATRSDTRTRRSPLPCQP